MMTFIDFKRKVYETIEQILAENHKDLLIKKACKEDDEFLYLISKDRAYISGAINLMNLFKDYLRDVALYMVVRKAIASLEYSLMPRSEVESLVDFYINFDKNSTDVQTFRFLDFNIGICFNSGGTCFVSAYEHYHVAEFFRIEALKLSNEQLFCLATQNSKYLNGYFARPLDSFTWSEAAEEYDYADAPSQLLLDAIDDGIVSYSGMPYKFNTYALLDIDFLNFLSRAFDDDVRIIIVSDTLSFAFAASRVKDEELSCFADNLHLTCGKGSNSVYSYNRRDKKLSIQTCN